jgi:hypothetical protein
MTYNNTKYQVKTDSRQKHELQNKKSIFLVILAVSRRRLLAHRTSNDTNACYNVGKTADNIIEHFAASI